MATRTQFTVLNETTTALRDATFAISSAEAPSPFMRVFNRWLTAACSQFFTGADISPKALPVEDMEQRIKDGDVPIRVIKLATMFRMTAELMVGPSAGTDVTSAEKQHAYHLGKHLEDFCYKADKNVPFKLSYLRTQEATLDKLKADAKAGVPDADGHVESSPKLEIQRLRVEEAQNQYLAALASRKAALMAYKDATGRNWTPYASNKTTGGSDGVVNDAIAEQSKQFQEEMAKLTA